MIKILNSLLILSLLQGCVAYPKAIKGNDYKRCGLISREYSLEVGDLGFKASSIQPKDILGVLVISGVVLSATAVVSGSFVLLGNTVHFLEKQGSCDDSFLNEQILSYITPLLSDGGELVAGVDSQSSGADNMQDNERE